MLFQRASCLKLACSVVALSASPLMAQVSGTEVNQEAVDGFGLERKTGRFSWSTEEVIGIGGEGARVSLSVNGIRNPPRATRIWPAPFTQVILNEPRLLSEPMPDGSSPIPGAIAPNLFNHTVQTSGGSETFDCFTACIPEYFNGAVLEETPDGFLYTSRLGLMILFQENRTSVKYPDGRQMTYRSGQYWGNNFGFMLKFSGGNMQAVNQAVDYCDPTTTVQCTGLTENRTASITSPGTGLIRVTDTADQATTLRWENKTAKLYRRPTGAPPSLFITDVTERYPLGIALPGSPSEDVTIQYHSIDPSLDTHDEVLISSIRKNGVTSTYEYQRTFPQGFPEAEPSAGETLNNLTGIGGLLQLYTDQCGFDTLAFGLQPGAFEDDPPVTVTLSPAESSSCNIANQIQALLPTLEELAIQQGFPGPPENQVTTQNGYNLLEMTIDQRIGGQLVGSSLVIQPAGGYANSRRRLLEVVEVIDGLNRVTRYSFNQFEEVAGRTAPEGNGVTNLYDGNGNLTSTVVTPKTGSGQLITTYQYPSDCTGLTLVQCNSPIAITDPRGNVTNYEYNQYGQVTKEIAPAGSPGEARPTVVNEYQLRTAYKKNASGNPVAAGTPISMLTKSYTCITSATCNASVPASDKVVTEYDYGPMTGLNNLLLRGMSVTAINGSGQLETLRTCYTYNYFGERVSETQPKADLTSCQ